MFLPKKGLFSGQLISSEGASVKWQWFSSNDFKSSSFLKESPSPSDCLLSLFLSFCLSLSLSTSSTSEQLSTLMEHSCEPPWWMDLRQTGDERGKGATIDRKGDDLNLTEQIKREQKTCEARRWPFRVKTVYDGLRHFGNANIDW